jgi:histone-lysine N-methyltransferase SETMAR
MLNLSIFIPENVNKIEGVIDRFYHHFLFETVMPTRSQQISYRAVIQFLTLEKTPPKEIHERMLKVYGNDCPSYSTIKNWAAEFHRGRNSLEDEERSGRPCEAVTEENVRAVEELVMEDRRSSVHSLAMALGISVGSVEIILHKHLGMSKVCARWVPRMLDPEMKMRRVQAAEENLEVMDHSWNVFKRRFLTGDETWIHHYDPESKQESMQWKHPDSPTPVKFRTQKTAGKIMCTIFWDTHGPILIDYMPHKVTITGPYYADLLHKLRDAIKKKRRGMITSIPLLLHDNAPAHTSKVARAALAECGFECLSHPPYSPDLAPSDFHLFPNLKKHLRGKRFSNNEELKLETEQWLSDQNEDFYSLGVEKLRERYHSCIAKQGSYVEK